jgi:hypothetical protein
VVAHRPAQWAFVMSATPHLAHGSPAGQWRETTGASMSSRPVRYDIGDREHIEPAS